MINNKSDEIKDKNIVLANSSDLLDVDFYTLYYDDLFFLSENEAQRHFFTHGAHEGRHATPQSMLQELERKFGAPDANFDISLYRNEHPHLRDKPHYPWQIVEHHLRNRGALKPSPTGRPISMPRVVRSWVEAEHNALATAFGPEVVDFHLTQAVARAAIVVAAHPTPASLLLEAVVLGRYFLSAPDALGTQLNSFATQLRALYFALFECPAAARSRAEMTVINRLISATVALELAPGPPGQPAVTLLMLAARAACGFDVTLAENDAEQYLADFFGRRVMEMQLEPFVTAKQRARLRDLAPPTRPAVPLGALYRWMAGPVRPSAPELAAPTPLIFNRWFWDEGVWTLKLDYILSGDQLSELSVAVESDGERYRLSMPDFLQRDAQGGEDALSPPLVRQWLTGFIDRQRSAWDISPLMIAPSALAYANDAPLLHATSSFASGSETSPDVVAALNLRLRPGEVLVFGRHSNGSPHCIGEPWREDAFQHRWRSETSALLALRLAAEDAGALDLFLELKIIRPASDARLFFHWNGRLIGQHDSRLDQGALHFYLGERHRTGRDANLLTITADGRTTTSQKKFRRPTFALRKLVLTRR